MVRIYTVQDGVPKLLADDDIELSIELIAEGVAPAIKAFESVSVSLNVAASGMVQLGRMFRALPNYELNRQRAIAKARGKNWRNVR